MVVRGRSSREDGGPQVAYNCRPMYWRPRLLIATKPSEREILMMDYMGGMMVGMGLVSFLAVMVWFSPSPHL